MLALLAASLVQRLGPNVRLSLVAGSVTSCLVIGLTLRREGYPYGHKGSLIHPGGILGVLLIAMSVDGAVALLTAPRVPTIPLGEAVVFPAISLLGGIIFSAEGAIDFFILGFLGLLLSKWQGILGSAVVITVVRDLFIPVAFLFLGFFVLNNRPGGPLGGLLGYLYNAPYFWNMVSPSALWALVVALLIIRVLLRFASRKRRGRPRPS
jgi:hypothetical protein